MEQRGLKRAAAGQGEALEEGMLVACCRLAVLGCGGYLRWMGM